MWVAIVGATLMAPAKVEDATRVERPVIRVIGRGTVRTLPDVATFRMSIRGEGSTSDEAVRALVTKRDAVEGALAGKAEVRTGRLSIEAARDRACDGDGEYDRKPRLSTDVCAVKGYVATLSLTARVAAPAEAGTLVGLAGRLGATDPELDAFELRNPAVAQRAALVEAMRDAREQASAIAAASSVSLGRLRRVEDQRAAASAMQDIVVTGQRSASAVVTPPIAVRLSPQPIETTASLVVEFEVGAAR